MARFALDSANHVWLVPAYLSPLKQETRASFSDRLAMVKQMVDDLRMPGRFSVLEEEGQRPGPSFTKDTLARLRNSVPGASIALVIGADNAAQFESWNSPEEILTHHPVLLFQRAGANGAERVLERLGARIKLDTRPVPDCSSTKIRSSLLLDEKGGSLRDCLSSNIWELIRSRGLYRHAQD